MLDHDDDPKTTDHGATADPDSPIFQDDDGNIDDDRQDPPTPEKVDGEDEALDGTTATPGDGPEDER